MRARLALKPLPPPPPPDPRACPAMTYGAECRLRVGHAGPHRGILQIEWTDVDDARERERRAEAFGTNDDHARDAYTGSLVR